MIVVAEIFEIFEIFDGLSSAGVFTANPVSARVLQVARVMTGSGGRPETIPGFFGGSFDAAPFIFGLFGGILDKITACAPRARKFS